MRSAHATTSPSGVLGGGRFHEWLRTASSVSSHRFRCASVTSAPYTAWWYSPSGMYGAKAASEECPADGRNTLGNLHTTNLTGGCDNFGARPLHLGPRLVGRRGSDTGGEVDEDGGVEAGAHGIEGGGPDAVVGGDPDDVDGVDLAL